MFFRSGEGPYIIAGPCSAESREQVLATAEALKELNINLFRAGVWKPRTRPGSFEGNGEKALEWLKEAKQQFNLPIVIEVAEPEHVALALKYDIDALWIGARTTVNPFQVQHIADALKGVEIPVLVKNPVNPDVSLWQGAIERLEMAGIKDIAAIHRGFSTYSASSPYRNQPNWPIPIELKRRKPELPVICDPSHITGNRSIVGDIAQKAMDMGFDGLMIETHPTPELALSDAEQQVTPQQLSEILCRITMRRSETVPGSNVELEHLRREMDSIDAEVIDLLARRMELSEKIGLVKKAANIAAYLPERWNEIVETRGERAEKLLLSREFVIALYERIHDESIKKQLKVLSDTLKELKK
ncbi:MAG TPA: bifunctional 3-deoxy-7-phosphoheptulonate synthase/chorismate mutase type II [Flavipsychrobacter sp.]|nr:bifunctional 3-deoxy-7-phosphoheptulonate synthase/chorismate mutase type II [Flavipsychrobacter sp.]